MKLRLNQTGENYKQLYRHRPICGWMNAGSKLGYDKSLRIIHLPDVDALMIALRKWIVEGK